MTEMNATLYVIVPLLVLGVVTALVLLWAWRHRQPAPTVTWPEGLMGGFGGGAPYDAGDGDIADLELAVHMGRKGEPAQTHAEFVAAHAPSEEVAALNKSLYVGAFAGGEYGDEALASHVRDIEQAKASAAKIQQLAVAQRQAERRARRWSWLPWRAYAEYRRGLIPSSDRRIDALLARIDELEAPGDPWKAEYHAERSRLMHENNALRWHIAKLTGRPLPDSLRIRDRALDAYVDDNMSGVRHGGDDV